MPRDVPPTLHAVVIWPFVEAVRRLGTVPPELTAMLDVEVAAGTRIPHESAAQLLEGAIALTGRQDLGLLAADVVEPGNFELVELAARAQRTVGEGLTTLASLAPILHDALTVKLTRGVETSSLRISFANNLRLHPAGYDFIAASLFIGGKRQTRSEALTPLRVTVPYAATLHPSALAAVLGCEVGYGGEAIEVEFATHLLDIPLVRADASMGQVLSDAARGLLEPEVAASKLASDVRAIVRDGLAQGVIDAAYVARKLHMSERTLRRKLDAEGIGLRDVIDALRHARALELLADDAMSMEEIATQLGFTTAQALHRAFRRWTGDTVQAHRARTRR
jgi:AraC-like DNA-binding protein